MITAFVLQAAADQWLAWRADDRHVSIAVNVPPIELTDLSVACALEVLLENGFDPTCLVIEVTERRIADVRAIEPTLERLRSWGVRLSIDDFGTGESTLLRLQELEFNEIKIDRALTAGIARSRTGSHIVRFVTELAHHLEMTVVAEGVENDYEFDALCGLGVDVLQGYHVGRPGPPAILERRLVG
jgi:EAL domain-containing protein (putative c-di-GMP-specific phosphodiesterase class I)